MDLAQKCPISLTELGNWRPSDQNDHSNRNFISFLPADMNYQTTIITLLLFVFCNETDAQSRKPKNKDKKKSDDRTVVIGQLSFPKPFKIRDIEIAKSQIVLIEEFVPRTPPTPEGYEELELSERTKWYQNFINSDAGKRFQASEEKRFSKLKKHEVQARRDADFRIKNVEPGNYDLAGELILNHRSKKYFTEFYAKVTITDVDQIDLEKIEVEPRRVLEVKDSTPEFSVKTLDGKKLKSSDLKKQPTLLFFWSSSNTFSLDLVPEIVAAKKQHKNLRIVGVSLDKEEKTIREFLKGNSLPGQHVHIKDFKDEICTEFGVIAIPSVWLIDGKGKIVVTDRDFVDQSFELESILKKSLKKNLF